MRETATPDTIAPTPNPMTFGETNGTVPYFTSPNSITMVADTATDETSSVSYYFTETSGMTGGTDSGWQSSRTYTDTGLRPNNTYSYNVKARDLSLNETAASADYSARTKGTSLTGVGVPIGF
jgi:hypothetical protein